MVKANKFWLKRRSVVMTWLISYVLVLFVPILFSLAVYWQTQRTIENQITRGNDFLLRQMQDTIDNQVASVKRLAAQIYANVNIQALFYSNKFFRGDYRYDLYQINQDLKGLQSTYSTFDAFYIYWAPGDIAIMPGLYREGSSAYEDLYTGGKLSLDDWKEQVRSTDSQRYLLTYRQSEGGRIQSYLNFISSFPADNKDNPVGSLVIMIDTKQLLQVTANVREFNGGEVIILSEDNQVLLSNAPMEETNPQFERHYGDIGSFNDDYQGEASQFSYMKSKNSGLTYLAVTPIRFVWKEAKYIRNLIYLSIAFSFIGGIVLTFVLLRRNYKPLSRLLQSLALQSGGSLDMVVNEFHFIQNAFSNTLDEKEQIYLHMKQQNNQLRANFLSRLLKGRLENQIPLSEALSTFDIHFESDDFCVILFCLEDNQPFFERIDQMQAPEKLRLLHFIVTNVVEELVNLQHNGYMTEIDDMMACLINFKELDQGNRLEELVRIAEEAQVFLKNKFEIDITVAISGIHPSRAGIVEGYLEALDAMEYKLVMGKREIIVYEHLQIESLSHLKDGYYYPLQLEQQLINYIKIGDVEKARHTLSGIMERNFNRITLSVVLTKCLMFDLISTFIKTIQEIGDVQETFLTNNPRVIENITASDTVSGMHSQLEGMLEEVCRYTSAKQELNRNKLRHDELIEFSQKIAQFIHLHYHDFNLNVSLIGENFGMKPTYLSKLFKDQTGEGVLDCINKVRIEKAKMMLKQDKAPLQEVANRCGFSDLHTFMRTFKKLEGITPGKYKVLD